MFLGIDIGSSSSKAAVIDGSRKLLATEVINLGAGSDAVHQVIKNVLKKAHITKEDIKYSIVTGYGRLIFKEADEQITEITCHGKAVSFLMPTVRTVIDIGGQDAKVICLGKNGAIIDFLMNEKCAAGTGRFLEVMARILGCRPDELSDYADQSKEGVTISSTCAVFAESEVISQLASGKRREDVARGAHVSAAKRVAGLANRVSIRDDIAMTGGGALNRNLVNALEQELGHKVLTLPEAQCMGAIGAALFSFEKYQRSAQRD